MDDVIRLFKEADTLDQQRALSMLYDNDKWPGKRQAVYIGGPIHGMYRERNEILTECIEISVNIERLKWLLIKSINGTHEHIINFNKGVYEANEISEEVQKRMDDDQQKRHDAEIESVKKAKDLEALLNAANDYNALFLKDLKDEPIERQLRFLELYFEYDEYKKGKGKTELFSESIPELDGLYCAEFDKKSAYKKYDLIPIDEVRTLKAMDPPRIYDSGLNKTIMITCSKRLVDVLFKLYEQGLIGEMSFKGTSEIYDGFFNYQYVLEEVERGKIFSLNFNTFTDVTKLYSKNYNDQLWIIKDGDDIYFEELAEDFEEFEDSVVTRMLHAEIGENSYIHHMDFEYIFYSLEDYEKRMQEANTEGTYKKRRKLFKIDKCKIPFDYKVEMQRKDYAKICVPIFYFVLNLYFEHKDLLNEYFEKACG